QAIKAGILEIADVLVVNKSDRPGADSAVRALKAMLELGHPIARDQLAAHHGQLLPVEPTSNGHQNTFWLPPIIRTVATDEQGIDELIAAFPHHRDYLAGSDTLAAAARQRIEIEMQDRLREALMAR